MPGLNVDQLRLPHRRRFIGSRLWREWCFARVVLRHVRVRLLIMLVVLIAGALLFRHYEPEKQHSMPRAMFYAWSLVFGEMPEAFPSAVALQALFFIMPVVGLTVIIEGIVDFALLLRDRQRAERRWCLTMASSLSDHIVLVGFGRLGYRVYRLLHRLHRPAREQGLTCFPLFPGLPLAQHHAAELVH